MLRTAARSSAKRPVVASASRAGRDVGAGSQFDNAANARLVTKNLPASMEIGSRPSRTAVRSVRSLIGPSGQCRRAASPRLMSSSSPQAAGSGRWATRSRRLSVISQALLMQVGRHNLSVVARTSLLIVSALVLPELFSRLISNGAAPVTGSPAFATPDGAKPRRGHALPNRYLITSTR